MPRLILIATALSLLGGCTAERALVASPPVLPASQASASVQDVTIVADSEAGAAAAARVTPVLVTVRNNGDQPVRVSPGQFGLVPQTLGPQLGAVPTPRGAKALPETVLQPGQVASGYVFFEKAEEMGTAMDLVAHIEAEDGAVIGTAVLPLLPPGSQLAGAPLN